MTIFADKFENSGGVNEVTRQSPKYSEAGGSLSQWRLEISRGFWQKKIFVFAIKQPPSRKPWRVELISASTSGTSYNVILQKSVVPKEILGSHTRFDNKELEGRKGTQAWTPKYQGCDALRTFRTENYVSIVVRSTPRTSINFTSAISRRAWIRLQNHKGVACSHVDIRCVTWTWVMLFERPIDIVVTLIWTASKHWFRHTTWLRNDLVCYLYF